VREKKGAENTLAASKQIRAQAARRRDDLCDLGQPVGPQKREDPDLCERHAVELCFTPTYSSWANPIECQFGPLREFVLSNSDHPSHLVVAKKIHAFLRWRNANAKHPDVLSAQRTERVRIRSERQRRSGRPAARASARSPLAWFHAPNSRSTTHIETLEPHRGGSAPGSHRLHQDKGAGTFVVRARARDPPVP